MPNRPLDRREFLKLASAAGVAWAALPSVGRADEPAGATSAAKDPLAEGFAHPPRSVRPGCYWWWLDGRVDQAGITNDLEEFAAKGIGEVLLVNSANLHPEPPRPDTIKFLSPEWRALTRHAFREAKRLGIEVGINLSGGWCMGGPWIPPRDAGRWFLQSELTVQGPQKFSGPLPLPGNRSGYDRVFNPPGFQDYIDLPLEKLDYRDTAVVAFPDAGSAQEKLSGSRAKLLPAKTNRKDASNFVRAREAMGAVAMPLANEASDHPIPPTQVIDLTSRLTPDGRLDWDVPPGRWTIVRTGHRMTGSKLMIPPPDADGLSVGWLSGEGVELQFENLGKLFLEDAAAVGTKLTYFGDDSFEDGFPNWTEKILERFVHYRGYDPVRYLPALAGYIVGSAEISDRFLYDYRRTVADCMADGHYGRFAALCHEHGLEVQNEAAGPSRSGTMCMDGLMNLGRSDRPMGEFWLGLRHDQPHGLDAKLGYGITRLEDGQNKVTKMVASAAHIYSRATASAESFTTMRHWLDSPATLKPAADRAFCEGINRLVIHESTATHSQEGKPGYEYYAGTHFNRNQTWWPMVGPFLEYIARCQFLLRQGQPVADVLNYVGDGAPNLAVPKHIIPPLGDGFDYDDCNSEVLLTRTAVKDGGIVLPDGTTYRVLVLPETRVMPAEVARKIRALTAAGATVIGPRPQQAPGLRDYPRCDADVSAIAEEVWGDIDGKAKTEHAYGRGSVFFGKPPPELLARLGIEPDFSYNYGDNISLDFVHRRTAEADIYFVVNRSAEPARAACHFRVRGRRAELWDPVSGERSVATGSPAGNACTRLDLQFVPHQSWFVVFRGSSERAAPAPAPIRAFSAVQEVSGPWQVEFDPAWGGPKEVAFAELTDWTRHPDARVRFYSGAAIYRTRFTLTDEAVRRAGLSLDLGVVKNIARVRLNGVALGIAWTAPWRVDISSAAAAGQNVLEIEVANLWPNRLLGDRALAPEKRFTRTNIPLPDDAQLLPSGLLGPVTVTAST